MADFITFSCGCKFPVNNGKISISFDAEEHDFQCSSTWDLIGRGDTKGVFQLESTFGQQYAQKLKPRSLEHLSALTAILRPGSIEAKLDDGRSITDHYIDRKNGLEEVTYLHPILEKSLSKTYAMMIYQEQSMLISQHVAGFNLEQADALRKAARAKSYQKRWQRLKRCFWQVLKGLA